MPSPILPRMHGGTRAGRVRQRLMTGPGGQGSDRPSSLATSAWAYPRRREWNRYGSWPGHARSRRAVLSRASSRRPTTPRGSPEPSQDALARAELPHTPFHGLRHSAATFLLLGLPPEGRQELARPQHHRADVVHLRARPRAAATTGGYGGWTRCDALRDFGDGLMATRRIGSGPTDAHGGRPFCARISMLRKPRDGGHESKARPYAGAMARMLPSESLNQASL